MIYFKDNKIENEIYDGLCGVMEIYMEKIIKYMRRRSGCKDSKKFLEFMEVETSGWV